MRRLLARIAAKSVSLLASRLTSLNEELAQARSQRDWYRYFYAQHASMERLTQYGTPDSRTKVYAEAISEFELIDGLIEGTIAPPPSNGPIDGGPIYFGARMCFLNQRDAAPKIYAMSYLGSAAWTHGKPFDTLRNLSKGEAVDAGFAARVINDHGVGVFTNEAGFFAPLSFNVADTTGDGGDDFWLGGILVASSGAEHALSNDTTLVGREVSFFRHGGKVWALSPRANSIEVFDPSAPKDGPLHVLAIEGPLASNRCSSPTLAAAA